MIGRTAKAALLVATLAGAGAGVAHADGLPVLGFSGPARGVRTIDGTRRYQARPRHHETVLTATSESGRLLARTVLSGRFDVPVVAYDGSGAGLSADAGTLVLIRPRVTFPQRSTELMILTARTLRMRRVVRLRGDFSFDALSPNGQWIYLIQYTSRQDPTRYRVRALSARAGKLLRRDIVDPHDRGEAMRGQPISRVSSSDGRWAYTLYDGNGRPFVHALDTARLTARCINVATFPANSNWFAPRLRIADRHLMVVLRGRTLSEIDTRSLLLLAAAPGRVVARPAAGPGRSGPRSKAGTTGIAFPIAMVVVLLGGVALAVRRRLGSLPGQAQAR
jgi:hypothetical protein